MKRSHGSGSLFSPLLPCTRALLFVLLLLSPAVVFSQQRWERTYGGTGSDGGYSAQQTSDGGYVVAGFTESTGSRYQVYLIKTNAFGDTLWTKAYGGAESEFGRSVQQTTDGGYIVAGYTSPLMGYSQVYLLKTISNGDSLWAKTFGGAGYYYGNSVQQTLDGGYIICGTTRSLSDTGQIFILKTNATGDTLWTRSYGGPGTEGGQSIRQTFDGGYVVGGFTRPIGSNSQAYLININSSGDTLWSKTYGDTNASWAYSVQQTSDSGYILAGGTMSFGNIYQVYLIKTNSSGDTIWTRSYGGADLEEAHSVRQSSDTGYIVTGYTWSFGNGAQVYLIKTTAFGDTLWTKTYGGADEDRGYFVQQTSDGGYIITGITTSFGNGYQVYLIKTDSLGNSTGVEETAEVRGQRLEVRITARPNPFTSFTTLPGHSAERFALYDISGRKVGTYRGDRVGEGLGAGVYFLTPEGGKDKPLRVVKLR